MIQVIELFAGIGAQAMALKMAGIDYHVVAVSEIDPQAIAGYQAIHGPVDNLGDITKIEQLPECDLMTYSWPCQSVSIAGKRAGMVEGSGTTSSLLWEVGRLLKIAKEKGSLPSILLAENVDAVLNKSNSPEFKKWVLSLSELGYTSSYRILNSAYYGTPQNRCRCFMVSYLGNKKFIFPKKAKHPAIMKPILDSEVEPTYLIPKKITDAYIPIKPIKSKNGLIQVGYFDKKGWFESNRRVYSANGTAPTVVAHAFATKIMDDAGKFRYLSPRECLRLQAFPEKAIDNLLHSGISATGLYKLAGNSIPVCCLQAIFEGIYKNNSFKNGNHQVTLANWVKDTGVSV